MHLIVALGNPGKEYENTRHNVGWRVVDAFAATLDGAWKVDKRLNAKVWATKGGEMPITLLKPLTFMNNSGSAVAALQRRNKKTEKLKNMVVIHDDIDLPLGTTRVSFGSSAGGHNGVQSIIDHLKTKDFWRVRIGVAPAVARADWKQKTDPTDFVLSPFSKAETTWLASAMPKLLELVHATMTTPRVHTLRLAQ